MITKAQAQTFAQSFVGSFMTRLQAAVEANAVNGNIGITGYPYPQSATPGQVTAFTNAAQNAGWTVVVDTAGFTVTLT